MRKLLFMKNVIILTITALLLKFLGIVLRVYMSNTIGAEGMGLYQLIFSIYVLISTFATAGLSTAVIKIISAEIIHGSNKSVKSALKKCLIISTILGFLSSTVLFFSAEYIGKYILNDARTVPALKILIFAFPFMSITSCLKGYFIALKDVTTPSYAQLLEQIVRIGLIFFLLGKFIPYGLSLACLAIMAGDVLSQTTSAFYSYYKWKKHTKNSKPDYLSRQKSTNIMSDFIKVGLPIALNKYVNTILHTIENVMVPNSLRKFYGSQTKALEGFGTLKGMAMPLIFFPSSFLTAITTLLIPEMSEAYELRQTDKIKATVFRTLSITIISSILIAGIFYTFAYELGHLIYNNPDVGFQLKMLAPIIPFMYLESIVFGILQGLNEQMSSLKYIIFDSIIRIILIYLIVASHGMNGFLLIMIISNLTTSCLNTRRLLKVTKVRIDFSNWIIKPLIALLIANICLLVITNFITLSEKAYLILGILVVSLVYLLILTILNFNKILSLGLKFAKKN